MKKKDMDKMDAKKAAKGMKKSAKKGEVSAKRIADYAKKKKPAY